MKRGWMLMVLALVCADTAEAKKPKPAKRRWPIVECPSNVGIYYVPPADVQEMENTLAREQLREPAKAPDTGMVIVNLNRSRLDDATGDGALFAFGDANNIETLDKRPVSPVVPNPGADHQWYATFNTFAPGLPPFDVHFIEPSQRTRCDVRVEADGVAHEIEAPK